MYRRRPTVQQRITQSANALSSSMPSVERKIAAVEPASLQRGTVKVPTVPRAPHIEVPTVPRAPHIDVPTVPRAPHIEVPTVPRAPHIDVPTVPRAPHVESSVERSVSPHPVNPWEARWKEAGARLLEERKNAGPAVDRYQSVPLKEASVPSSSTAKPAASPARSEGFTTRPLTSTTDLAYPVPPSILPSSRLGADPSTRSVPQPSMPGTSNVSFEKITSYDRQPALPWQTRDRSSPINSPYHASTDVRTNPIDDAGKQSEPENSEVLSEASHREEGLDHDAGIVQPVEPVERFVADTSWTGTNSYFETSSSEVIMSISTAACRHQEVEKPSLSESARPPRLRTATLLDPGTPPADGHERIIDDGDWPSNPRREPVMEPLNPRPRARLDLPSAKEILAAASSRHTAPSGKALNKEKEDPGKPTEWRQPDQWFPHLWLVWPPTALLVLGLGIVGSLLSFRWSGDSYNAAVVSHRLLVRSENPAKEKPLPESVVPPESSWWRTTPLHLAEWGVYLGRQKIEGDRTDEARELIEAAVRIAPISPAVRLGRAQLAAKSSKPASGVLDLGLTRDAVSLAWSASALRQAGNKESAIRLYRQALRLACDQELAADAKPTFNDEPNARRYFLPGEATARAIVSELITDTGLTFQEWSEVLSGNTVATLAAARVLRVLDRPEAQTLLELLLDQDQVPDASGSEGAVRVAVRAEAHALLSQWREAEQQYHEAIDQVTDLTIKRSWWFNLATVALQLNDEGQRRVALEAAREAPTSDDISRRALELQRASEPLGRLRQSGTKAN